MPYDQFLLFLLGAQNSIQSGSKVTGIPQVLKLWIYGGAIRAYRLHKYLIHWIYGTTFIDRIIHSIRPHETVDILEKETRSTAWSLPSLGTNRLALWRLITSLTLSQHLQTENNAILTTSKLRTDSHFPTASRHAMEAVTHSIFLKKMKAGTDSDEEMLGSLLWMAFTFEHAKHCFLALRNIKVQSEVHMGLLQEIWVLLTSSSSNHMASLETGMLTEKSQLSWQDIGFQGKDPRTDFRATGSLGLIQLHAFCRDRTTEARIMIRESGMLASREDLLQLPWYPFALVGIHITAFGSDLLSSGQLNRYSLSNGAVKDPDLLSVMQCIYDEIFLRFHTYWTKMVQLGHVKDILAFEATFAAFKEQYINELSIDKVA